MSLEEMIRSLIAEEIAKAEKRFEQRLQQLQANNSLSPTPVKPVCKMPQAEKILPFKRDKIREMIADGTIKKAEQIGGAGHWYFDREELEELALKLRKTYLTDTKTSTRSVA